MAQAGVPSTEQLLDLLRRAADELKTAREEAARARQETADAQGEVAKLQQQLAQQQTQFGQEKQQLVDAQQRLQTELQIERAAGQDLAAQVDGDRTMLIPPKGKKNKKKGGQQPLEIEPVKETTSTGADLDALKAELAVARKSLEQEQEAHVATRQQLDIDRQQALEAVERNLVASRQEVADLREQLKIETGRNTEMAEQVAQAHAEQETLRARLEAAEAGGQVFEQQRQQLEEAQKAAIAEAQQQVQQVETLLSQEKEKHQATAQKWVTERERGREMERVDEELKKRLAQLETDSRSAAESGARQLADRDAQLQAQETAHQKNVESLQRSFVEQSATRESQLQQVSGQLEATTQERMFVERKFEELHRELLVVLEQRDDARRQLEAVQAERQRLERALTQRQ
ncbi:MAG: hypothetical protein QM723_26740 [Myxococcaceae bacterium]